jgi:streptogrisin C
MHAPMPRLVTVLITLTALLFVPASVAAADEIIILTEEQAIAEDARQYSVEYGVTHREAIRRLTLQPASGDVIAAAEAELQDEFAGGWIEHVPNYGIVVRFTGPGPSRGGWDALVAISPVPVRFESAKLSLGQMEAALERSRALLAAEDVEAALEIDVRTGQLRIWVQESLSPELHNAVEWTAGQTTVVVERDEPVELEDSYGGKRLTRQGTLPPINECTSTFAIRNVVTGETGVLTAGHCRDALHYWHNGTIHYDITLRGQRWDADQDWQWHSTPGTDTGLFWDGDSYRSVTGTEPRSSMVGDFACHYGWTTGYSCGTIQSITYSSIGGGCNGQTCAAVYARVTGSTLNTGGGDSGGPWFSAGRAYGVHTAGNGDTQDPPNVTGVFNTINYISGTNNNLAVILGP